MRETATQILFAAKGQNLPTFLVGTSPRMAASPGRRRSSTSSTPCCISRGAAPRLSGGAGREEPVRRRQRTRRVRDDRTRVRPVPNPSELFLSQRPANTPGSPSCAASKVHGPCWSRSRPSSAPAVRQRPTHRERGRSEPAVAAAGRAREARRPNLVAEDVFVNMAGGSRSRNRRPTSPSSRPSRRASGTVRFAIGRPFSGGGAGGRGAERHPGSASRARGRTARLHPCVVPDGNCAAEDVPAGCELVDVRTGRRGARGRHRLVIGPPARARAFSLARLPVCWSDPAASAGRCPFRGYD